MWSPGEEWQCGGCTSFTSQFTRLDFLANYDARYVIVTTGPIEEALAYRAKVGNKMEWYSSADSPFAADVDAPPNGGFAINVFLRNCDTVYRTWHTSGRGVEQLTHTFALIDVLPWGRQEQWQDSPPEWPTLPTYSGWLDSPDIARLYGTDADAHTLDKFTIEEIEALHDSLGTMETLADYIRALATLGVIRYDSFVADGHSEYHGADGHIVQSNPAHDHLDVAAIGDPDAMRAHIDRHTRQETSYLEMSKGLAAGGVERWSVDTQAMTMTYADGAGNALLVERLE